MHALLVFLISVSAVQNPRPNGWVTDQANVLDQAAEDKLNTLAETLYRGKGIEMAIVTVDNTSETPKQFATKLFNTWHIGNAQTNTGVLVLLVMGKRRLEVETGTGIEAALTAQWLADMQAQYMVPRFKEKNFAGGLVDGVQQIVDHLQAAPGESTSDAPPGEYRDNGAVTTQPGSAAPVVQPVTPQPPPQSYTPPPDEDSSKTPYAVGGIGLLGVGGGAGLLARYRRRQRICDRCKPERKMFSLDEVEDDKHLDEGQRTEERLGSVDYEVLICRGCQFSRTIRHNKWFSGYSRCSSCSYKTLQSSSSTIVSATYDHGGQVQVTEDCKNCSYHNTYTRYTSKLTPPSSSSSSSSSSSYSSGGGSFGGGSSSGGGAGSSW